MSKPKKLNISYDELIKIVEALNKNILDNRTRDKDNKISTDKYIKNTFNINRKDFSFTIKETGIKYNASTFLYDIPDDVNKNNTKVNFDSVNQCNKIVNLSNPVKQEDVNQDNTKSILKTRIHNSNLPKNTYEIPNEFKELLSLKNELKEMLQWWKKQNNVNIIDIPEINLNNNEKLTGEVTTKSYKIYKKAADEFSEFATTRKESIKDLISLALLEFVKRYKK